jgi:hypothetical protein
MGEKAGKFHGFSQRVAPTPPIVNIAMTAKDNHGPSVGAAD